MSLQCKQQGQYGNGNGSAPVRRQAISWTDANPVHWRIYAALERDGLINRLMIPTTDRNRNKMAAFLSN